MRMPEADVTDGGQQDQSHQADHRAIKNAGRSIGPDEIPPLAGTGDRSKQA